MSRLTAAYLFAAERHTRQRRKGEAQEPYINHLCEVAQLVAEATVDRDENLVIAAVLHDTIEDTDTEPEELRERFGEDVTALVLEATDDKSLPKEVRKRLQVEAASGKSARAKIVKLADKTSNLRALVASPPAEWPIERRRGYVEWAAEVAAGLRGTSAALDRAFDNALSAARSLPEPHQPGHLG